MMIGYVGLGAMGGALARNLLRTHDVMVFDRSTIAAEGLGRAGATVAAELREIGERCDTVFLCLPTSTQVADVLLGPDALLASLSPGAIVIDQTSGDPAITRRLAAELAAQDVTLVDAPVSGGVERALDGTIAVMVGTSEETFARVQPLLSSLTTNLFHAGDVGAGHAMKLVNNVMSGTQRLLTFECLALAAKNGIDPSRAHTILMAGGARNSFLEKVVGPSTLGGAPAPQFSIRLAYKDVRLACQMGADSGVPMFLGAQAREMLQMCMAQVGEDAEVDQVALVIERMSGTRIVGSHDIFTQGQGALLHATDTNPEKTTEEAET
jgi:3-hydroxyisobutyrate dehydrogenase